MCLTVKPVGEPDAGNPHVRFDERGWETERWPQAPSYRALPRLYHCKNALCRKRFTTESSEWLIRYIDAIESGNAAPGVQY